MVSELLVDGAQYYMTSCLLGFEQGYEHLRKRTEGNVMLLEDERKVSDLVNSLPGRGIDISLE